MELTVSYKDLTLSPDYEPTPDPTIPDISEEGYEREIEVFEGPEGRIEIELGPVNAAIRAAQDPNADIFETLKGLKQLDYNQLWRLSGILLLEFRSLSQAYQDTFTRKHLEFLEKWLWMVEKLDQLKKEETPNDSNV